MVLIYDEFREVENFIYKVLNKLMCVWSIHSRWKCVTISSEQNTVKASGTYCTQIIGNMHLK